MGGGKGSSKIRVTDYHATITYGICHGVVDSLNRVLIQNRPVFFGNVTDHATLDINLPNLFGGPKREGGARGLMFWQKGTFDQFLAPEVAAKFGGTPANTPAFRGIATATFTERPGLRRRGFLWRTNTPFIPAVSFDVTCLHPTWQLALRGINSARSAIRNFASGVMAPSTTVNEGDALPVWQPNASTPKAVLFYEDLQNQSVILEDKPSNYLRFTHQNPFAADRAICYLDLYEFTGGASYSSLELYVEAEVQQTVFGTVPTREGVASFVYLSGLTNPPTAVQDAYPNASTAAYPWAPVSTGWVSAPVGARYVAFTVGGGIGAEARNMKIGIRGVFTAFFQEANPAHIIHECLTNTVWGMGAPVTVIDDASFVAAATTLHAENFGLSFIWKDQLSIQDFVQEVLDHIDAGLFVDKATGLFVLRLIRDDYVIGDLPVLDESNSVVETFRRPLPGEMVTELTVSWTNPENEKQETVSLQDPQALAANDGEPVPDTRNYYGVRDIDLAWELCQRDLSVASSLAAQSEVLVNKSQWRLNPTDRVVLDHPNDDRDINSIVMLVSSVEYGAPDDPEIKLTLRQDTFTLERGNYERPPSAPPGATGQDPTVVDFPLFMTLNYFLLGYYTDQATQVSVAYPDAGVAILSSTLNDDAQDIDVYGSVVDPAGNVTTEALATVSVISRGELPQEFVKEEVTVSPDFLNSTEGELPVVGAFGLIGDESTAEEGQELVMFQAFDGANWTIIRGILDTTPKLWPVNTPVRFFSDNSDVLDGDARADGEDVTYQLAMRTTLGLLPQSSAPVVSYTANARALQPTRPANVMVAGVAWSTVDVIALDPVPVTWAERNRLTEDSQVLRWTDAGILPEPGQTTTIRVLDPSDRSVVSEVTGLSGGSHDLPKSAFGSLGQAIVQVLSEANGLESFQAYEQPVIVASGYGLAYGVSYGP